MLLCELKRNAHFQEHQMVLEKEIHHVQCIAMRALDYSYLTCLLIFLSLSSVRFLIYT